MLGMIAEITAERAAESKVKEAQMDLPMMLGLIVTASKLCVVVENTSRAASPAKDCHVADALGLQGRA